MLAELIFGKRATGSGKTHEAARPKPGIAERVETCMQCADECPDGVIVLHIRGRDRLVYANPAARNMFHLDNKHEQLYNSAKKKSINKFLLNCRSAVSDEGQIDAWNSLLDDCIQYRKQIIGNIKIAGTRNRHSVAKKTIYFPDRNDRFGVALYLFSPWSGQRDESDHTIGAVVIKNEEEDRARPTIINKHGITTAEISGHCPGFYLETFPTTVLESNNKYFILDVSGADLTKEHFKTLSKFPGFVKCFYKNLTIKTGSNKTVNDYHAEGHPTLLDRTFYKSIIQ